MGKRKASGNPREEDHEAGKLVEAKEGSRAARSVAVSVATAALSIVPSLAIPLSAPHPTCFERTAELLIAGLTGSSAADRHRDAITTSRKQCLDGNPFPLCALLWPDLLVADSAEAVYFDGAIDDPIDPCLRLDRWQRDIIRSFFDDSITEIFVKGNTKPGKGTSVAIGVNLWFECYESRITLTSQRSEHAIEVIFGEVARWYEKRAFPSEGCRCLSTTIRGRSRQHYILVANPKSGEGFSGQHGENTLIVIDEATGVDDARYDDAKKQAKKLVAIANPRTLSGFFRSSYPPKDKNPDLTQIVDTPGGRRHCFTVGGGDCLNVRTKRLERPYGPAGGIEVNGHFYAHNERITPEDYESCKPLIPGQIDYARYLEICSHPDPRHVNVFGHGKFPEEDPERQLILGGWLARHEAAWRPTIPVEVFSLDVAASLDGDLSALAAGGKDGCREIHTWKYRDTSKTIAEVVRICESNYGIRLTEHGNPIVIDSTGLGKGVGDRLREMGCWVIEFVASASSEANSQRYANLRAESYGELGRRLNPDEQWGKEAWALPADPALREELPAPLKVPLGVDALKFYVTPKAEIKKDLGRSPDRGDAVAMLWHGVRAFHKINTWVQAAMNRQVVAYPQVVAEPVNVSTEEKARKLMEQEAIANNDIVAWARARYGGLRERTRERETGRLFG